MSYITQREQRCQEQRYVLSDGNEATRKRSEERPPTNRLNSSEDGSSWKIGANLKNFYLLDYVKNLKTLRSCKEPSSKSFGMQAGDAKQDLLRLKENEFLKSKLADYEDRLSKYQSQLAKLTECGAFNMPREIRRLEQKLLTCQPYKEQIEIYKKEVFLLKRHCKALQNVKEENDSLTAQLTASYEREDSNAAFSLSSQIYSSNLSSELSMDTCQLRKLVTDLRKSVSNLNSVKRERDLLRQEVKRLNIKVKQVDENYYGELLCLRKRAQSLDVIMEQRNNLQSLLFQYDSVDEIMKKLIEKAKNGDKALEERNSLVNQLNLMKSDYDECKRASVESSETISMLTSSMKAMATDRDMLLRKIQENDYVEMKLEALKSSFREQSLNLQVSIMERDMYKYQCQRLAAYVKPPDSTSKIRSQQQDAACESVSMEEEDTVLCKSSVANEMQLEGDDTMDKILKKVTPKQRQQIETKDAIDEQIEILVSLLNNACRGNCSGDHMEDVLDKVNAPLVAITGKISLKMDAGVEEPYSYIKKPTKVKENEERHDIVNIVLKEILKLCKQQDTTKRLMVTKRGTSKEDSPKGIVYDKVRDLFKRLPYFTEHNGEIVKQRYTDSTVLPETLNEIQMHLSSIDEKERETDKCDKIFTAKKAIEPAELAPRHKCSSTDTVLIEKNRKNKKELVNDEKGVSTDTVEICKQKQTAAQLPVAVKIGTRFEKTAIDEVSIEQLACPMDTTNQTVVMAIAAQKEKEEEHIAFADTDKTEETVIKKLVTIFEKTAHIIDRKSKNKPVEFMENKLLTGNKITKLKIIPPTKQEEYLLTQSSNKFENYQEIQKNIMKEQNDEEDLLKVISNFKNQLEGKSAATSFPSTTSTISPVKNKVQLLTNQLSTADRKVKNLEVELAKLKQRGKKREAKMNANIALEEDANIMRIQELTEATKRVNELANENTRLKSDNKKMLNDIKDLRRRVTAVQAELDTLKHHYETRIKDMVKVHERNMNSIENVHKDILEETLLANKINEEKLNRELTAVRRNCICNLTKTNRVLKQMVNQCMDVKHSDSNDVKYSEKKCSCLDAHPDENESQQLPATAVAEIIAKISSEGLEGLNCEELRILHSETCKVIASIRWFKVKRQKRSRTALNSWGRSQTSEKSLDQRSISAEHKSCPCLKKIKRNYREHLVNQDISQDKFMELQSTLQEDKLLIEKIRDSKISCNKEKQEFCEKNRGKNYQHRTNLPPSNLPKTDAERRCKCTYEYISMYPAKEMREETPLVYHCSENNISNKKPCGRSSPNAYLEGGSKTVQPIYMAYSTRSHIAEIDDKTNDFINNIKFQSSSKIVQLHT